MHSLSTGLADTPRFLLVYSGLIVFPGLVLTGIVCPRVSPLERWSLSLVMGLLSSSALFWALAGVGLHEWVLVLPAAALAAVALRPRLLQGLFGGPPAASHALLLVVVALTLYPVVAGPGPLPFDSFAPGPDGRITRAMVDFEFHLAIVRELVHTVPPQSPFTAGIPLHYHYASDLAGALLVRNSSLQPTDLVVRFLPPVLLIQAVLAVFCCARLWLGSGAVAGLVAGLTLLGGDLTWLVAALCRTVTAWDPAVFLAPTVPALYAANPILPAVALLFAGLFALLKACREGGGSWIGVAALLFAALMEFKLFTGLHVLAALVASAIWTRAQGAGRVFAVVAGLAGAAALVSLGALLLGGSASPQTLRLAPLHLLESTANALCILPSIDRMVQWHSALRFAFLLGIVLPVFLLGCLGPRLVGAPRLVAALRARRATWTPDAACWWLLAAIVVVGFVATAAFQLTRREEPGSYNNSIWFLVQTKYVLWLFVGDALLSIRRRGVRLAVAVLTVALSAPSTVAWARAARTRVPTLDGEQTALVRVLSAQCRHGAVVFAPYGDSADPASARTMGEVISLAGCRSLLAGPFAEQFISRAEWDSRQLDAQRFWKAWRKGWLRRDILERYEARLVVERTSQGTARPKLETLFAGDTYWLYSLD